MADVNIEKYIELYRSMIEKVDKVIESSEELNAKGFDNVARLQIVNGLLQLQMIDALYDVKRSINDLKAAPFLS